MGYGSDFYRSVQLGIEATGQQGVDALANSMHAAERAFATFQAQVKAGATVTAQQVKDLSDLKAAADKATEAYSAATRVIAGKSAEAKGGIEGITNATLQLSRGLEDLSTGGFLGILNNLPGIGRGVAQSFGLAAPQIAAVETAVSLLGTGSYLLYTHWQKLKDLMDDGTGPRLLPDLRSLSKELDELKEKKLPSLIDQMDMQNLDRTIDRLGKIDAAIKAMKGATADEQKRGKVVGEGVREGGGFDAVVKAYTDATEGPESPEEAKARKHIADLEAKAQDAQKRNDIDAETLYAGLKADAEKTAGGQKAAARANRKTGVERLVGAAGMGDEAARADLANVYDRSRPTFENNGVSFRFRQGLEDASPLKLHDEEQQRIAAESEKLYKEALAKDVREAVQNVKKGFDSAAADAIQSAIQAGTSPDDAKKAAKTAMLPQLKARGIGKSIVDAVAEQIADDARDEAQNRINEGQKSQLQTRRDQAADKAKRETEQDVNKFTSQARGGYIDQAEVDIYQGLKGGKGADALQAAALPKVAGALRDRGNIPANLVEDVARKIIAQAAEKAMSDLDAGKLPAPLQKRQTATDAAQKKQIADLGPAYLDWAESLLARNRAAAKAGAPVARSEVEVQKYRRSNVDFALPEGEAQRRVGADLARGLKNTGQDPALAAPMMRQAVDKLGDSVSKSMATGASEQEALVAVIHDLADQFGQLQQHVMTSAGSNAGAIAALQKKTESLRQRTGMVGHQVNRGVKQRPSTIQFIP